MFLEYLFIEFIGQLWPWNYHEILNVYPPNGGMPHLLFLVAMRAISIYGSQYPFASISSNGKPSIFKSKVSELVTGLQKYYHHKHGGNDHVHDSTANVTII